MAKSDSATNRELDPTGRSGEGLLPQGDEDKLEELLPLPEADVQGDTMIGKWVRCAQGGDAYHNGRVSAVGRRGSVRRDTDFFLTYDTKWNSRTATQGG